MNDEKLEMRVHDAVDKLFLEKGYAAPVDVLMETGILKKEKYLDWRNGKIPYLEMVCTGNLNKLSQVLAMIRSYAVQKKAKPSLTFYGQYATKNKRKLRFSKSGDRFVEEAYSTHYVNRL